MLKALSKPGRKFHTQGQSFVLSCEPLHSTNALAAWHIVVSTDAYRTESLYIAVLLSKTLCALSLCVPEKNKCSNEISCSGSIKKSLNSGTKTRRQQSYHVSKRSQSHLHVRQDILEREDAGHDLAGSARHHLDRNLESI
jgi:hypothetical protein